MLDCGHANLFLELHTRITQDKPTWVQFKFYDISSWTWVAGMQTQGMDVGRREGQSTNIFWAKHAWMVSSMPLILCHRLGKVYAQFLNKCRETKIGHAID